jgi:hypothetical protein
MDVIKGSGMGKHGLGVKVRWGGLVSREKGMLKGFWGVAEDLTEISLIRMIKIFATVLLLWRADLIHWGFLDAF